MPSYRSWSQLSDYEKCPQSYKLKRVDKVWSRPAAWLGMGNGVHKAVEEWELSGQTMTPDEAFKVAKAEYREQINKALAQSPNTSVWASSGPYKGPEDILRRDGLLTEHTMNYIRYYTQTKPERVPQIVDVVSEFGAESRRAIELPFSIKLDGVEVQGKIDKVELDTKTGIVRVVDVKTGQDPGGPSQLKVYAIAMEDQYGHEEITRGSFFMTKRGTPTRDKVLTEISRDEIVNRFGEADQGIKAEKWDPKIGDHCTRCDVNTSCPFVN